MKHAERVSLSRPNRVHRERGVVLFVALIVLVVMALTGLAMIRQSGTGLSISGNLGFRQNALTGADLGTETANVWLTGVMNTPGALDADIPAQGYFSDWGTNDPGRRLTGDPTLYDWDNAVVVTSDDGSGNEVRYIVERLCSVANESIDAVNQKCVESPAGPANKSASCEAYETGGCIKPTMTPHYRVSSRVKGPRNTVSFIQVMLIPST